MLITENFRVDSTNIYCTTFLWEHFNFINIQQKPQVGGGPQHQGGPLTNQIDLHNSEHTRTILQAKFRSSVFTRKDRSNLIVAVSAGTVTSHLQHQSSTYREQILLGGIPAFWM